MDEDLHEGGALFTVSLYSDEGPVEHHNPSTGPPQEETAAGPSPAPSGETPTPEDTALLLPGAALAESGLSRVLAVCRHYMRSDPVVVAHPSESGAASSLQAFPAAS